MNNSGQSGPVPPFRITFPPPPAQNEVQSRFRFCLPFLRTQLACAARQLRPIQSCWGSGASAAAVPSPAKRHLQDATLARDSKRSDRAGMQLTHRAASKRSGRRRQTRRRRLTRPRRRSCWWSRMRRRTRGPTRRTSRRRTRSASPRCRWRPSSPARSTASPSSSARQVCEPTRKAAGSQAALQARKHGGIVERSCLPVRGMHLWNTCTTFERRCWQLQQRSRNDPPSAEPIPL